MRRKGYWMSEERHTTPPVFYRDEWKSGFEFTHAIRRADNSLVFRANGHDQALRLLTSLEPREVEGKD